MSQSDLLHNIRCISCAIAPDAPEIGLRTAIALRRVANHLEVRCTPGAEVENLTSPLLRPVQLSPGDGAWTAGSDVLVIPRYTRSLLNTVYAAWGRGIPIISIMSAAGSSVLDEAAFILRAGSDFNAILSAIQQVTADPILREGLVRTGRERLEAALAREASGEVRIYRRWKAEPRRKLSPEGLGIGVVTYDRLECLQGCVRALERFTQNYYLVIADDGSTDGTSAWARECGIPVVTGRHSGAAWNRNRALRHLLQHTMCDPILLLEDDCWPALPEWAVPWITAANQWGHVDYTFGAGIEQSETGVGTAEAPYLSPLPTGGCSITTRALLERVGYVDVRFQGCDWEHREWAHRFWRAGQESGAIQVPAETYPCLTSGVELAYSQSHSNQEHGGANLALAMALRKAPIHRPAARTIAEREELCHEAVRARWSECPAPGEPGLISVICPSRTLRLLQQLVQSLGAGPFEFICVWNGETAITTVDLGLSSAQIVRYCDEPFNYSTAINRGAAVARGEILVILNDDVRFTCFDLWSQLLELYSSRPDTGACYGGLAGAWRVLDAPEAPAAEGCSWSVSKYAFEQMGGLDEALTGYGLDEFVTRVRLARLGYAGRRLQGWTYEHTGHQTFRQQPPRTFSVRSAMVGLGWDGIVPEVPLGPAVQAFMDTVLAGEAHVVEATPNWQARSTKALVAPLHTNDCTPPWQGRGARKPWDYRISAVIPHLETPGPLRACVELLRLQTEPPYIMIVDTGSSPAVRDQLEALRGEDLEIHSIGAHGYLHPSEAVAVAQDLAFAICRSEFLYCTHSDCFLRRRDYLSWLVLRCRDGCPAIGYEMSPRDWLTDEWQGMISHTASLFHMPTMHRLGVTWGFERAHRQFGISRTEASWPDTETCMNLVLRAAGVRPRLIGAEKNFCRQVDSNIDHVRSFPGSQVYAPEYHATASGWMAEALAEAWQRIGAWKELTLGGRD